MSEFFTTKRQAADFERALSEIESSLYKTDLDLEKVLKNQLGNNKKDKFLILLRENKIPLDSNSDIKNFFAEIRKATASMDEIKLTLAIEPNDEILKAVSDWFVLNFKRQALINTEIDNNTTGGAEVYFQGKHFDASVKKVFEKLCNGNLSDEKNSNQETGNVKTSTKNSQINTAK